MQNNIPLLPTDNWKTTSFNGVTFKMPPDYYLSNSDTSSSRARIATKKVGVPETEIAIYDYSGKKLADEYFFQLGTKGKCSWIYKERMFGKIQALEIVSNPNDCQGLAGSIVFVKNNKFVMMGNSHTYDPKTKIVSRHTFTDTVISTVE